jgi:hypothetical protein
MEKITEKEIRIARDKAFEKAGLNAYFGNGFEMGVQFAIKTLSKTASTTAPIGNAAEFIASMDLKYGSRWNVDEDKLIQAMEEYAQQKTDWVSVDDKLPIVEMDVLMFTKSLHIITGTFSDNCFDDNTFVRDDITHWQPLPEPPKV